MSGGAVALTADRRGATSPRTTARRALVAGAFVLALAGVLAALATRVGRPYLPLGDEANIDLRVRDVFTGDTPLVGAYSRGFNHPGPWLFWLLASVSAVTGGAAWANLVGGALLQGVGIAGSGWLALRRGGVGLALLVLAAIGLGYTAIPIDAPILRTWNPLVAFPFFVLFLLQVWALACGARWQLLGGLVTGSFLVHLHVGYAPLVAFGAVWVVVVLVTDRRARTAAGPDWKRVAAWSAVALALLWVGPVIDQLTNEPGNLSALVDDVRSGDGGIGLERGAGLFAAEFAPPPPWLGGHDALEYATNVVKPASTLWLLVPAALLALGFVAAHHSGRRDDRRLVELAAFMSVATVVVLSQVDVAPVPFLFYWRIVVALLVVVASAYATARWLRLGRRPVARLLCATGLVVALVAGAWVQVSEVIDHRDALADAEVSARDFFRLVDGPTRPRGTVLVRGLGGSTNGVAQGLVNHLDREDVAVRVDPGYEFQYGDRTADASHVDEVWYVSQDGRFRTLLDDGRPTRIVATSPLPDRDERELVALQEQLAGELEAAGRADLVDVLDSPFLTVLLAREEVAGIDPGAAARATELNDAVARSGRCRCTLVAYPASTAPDLPFTMGF